VSVSLGLQSPWWLAALALVLPLVWLYLRPRVRPPASVSSLRIWRRAVPRVEAPTRKPKLPLLFFVQVALLAACAFALARPFAWEKVPLGPPPDQIVILDVSASMQAREQGATRFESARDAAIQRLREVASESPTRRFTVIAAALQPSILGSGLSADEAARALGELQPVDTAANLTAAVEIAATRAGTEGAVDLFTDLSADALVVSRDARDATRVHRFGTSDDNVAIVGLEVLANPLEDAVQKRVVATVRNASAVERSVEVELAPLAPVQAETGVPAPAQGAPSGAATADAPGQAPLRQTIALAPGESEAVAFAGIPWSGPFAARLSHADALPLDDVVYGHLPAPQPLEVLLVSDDTRLRNELSDLAKRAGRVDLRTLSTGEWSPERARAVTVFDRFVPTLPPAGNVLYLAPPNGNGDVAVTGSARGVKLAELRDHDLVRGLKSFDGLLADEMSVLSAGGDLRPLALGRGEQREHALVLAGESGGRRIVATAFPLRADTIRRADGLSALLFLVRSLRWLSPAQAHAPIERLTGERLRASLRGAAPISRLEGPGGARDFAPTEEITLERAGVYRALSEGTETPLLVSFIDPAESSIGRPAIEPPAPRARPAAPAAPSDTAWAQRTLLVPFLVAVLALMVGEWILVAMRRFSGSKTAPAEGR
jgi:Ca-activated chloride channel homolog